MKDKEKIDSLERQNDINDFLKEMDETSIATYEKREAFLLILLDVIIVILVFVSFFYMAYWLRDEMDAAYERSLADNISTCECTCTEADSKSE